MKFDLSCFFCRALKRLEGEDVYGRKIHVEAVSGLHRVPVKKPPQEEGKTDEKHHVAKLQTSARQRSISLGPEMERSSDIPVNRIPQQGTNKTNKNEEKQVSKLKTEATSRCTSLGPDIQRVKATCSDYKCSKSLESRGNSTSVRNSKDKGVGSWTGTEHKRSAGKAIADGLDIEVDVITKDRSFSRQSSLNSIYQGTSTDSRSSTPGLVNNSKSRRRKNRQRAKKANGKKMPNSTNTELKVTCDSENENAKCGQEKRSESGTSPKKKKATVSEKAQQQEQEELVEPLVVLASGKKELVQLIV